METSTDRDHVTPPEAVVAALRAYGVDRVFGVAGESYLPLLEALRVAGDIDVVTCRHEGSAGFAAIADAKLTGRPGVVLVSRGPGATNAAVAVHAAAEDAVPLLLVVGQVPRAQMGRPTFQSLDCAALFGGLAKGVWTVPDPARTAEFAVRALQRAATGTPGPTVLAVPEDVFGSLDPGGRVCPVAAPATGPAAAVVDDVAARLRAARRPVLLAGELLAGPDGRAALAAVAGRHGLPVVAVNKHQHLLDNHSRWYCGHLHNSTAAAQRAAFAEADLILAVGARLDPVTTAGYRFPAAPAPRQPLVQVHPDPHRIGEIVQPALGVAADPVAFLEALAAIPAGIPERPVWTRRLRDLERDQAVWRPTTAPDGIVFGEVVAALDRLTGGSVTVAVDSGGFTSWVYRYLRFAGDGRLLGVASSTMGFAVPAGVAAALRRPAVPTVAVVGDGGFGMNGSELATAVAAGVPLVVVVADNGSYGTIRNHQERVYPGRVVATDLVNPDFARLAEAYGALGLPVREPDEIEPALAKALAHPGVAVLDVRTSLTHFGAHRRLGEKAAR
jgi:acetolactate synthase I/II/III large subunit